MAYCGALLVDWSDKIELRVVDVTEQLDVARQYGVWSLPTSIVLGADRSVVAINQGVAHAQKLREQFERAATNAFSAPNPRLIEPAT